jgi:hypothetical protein
MRRVSILAVLLAPVLVPAVATAKLPFFGLEAAPLRPRVGQPITITMTCYEDADHTRASSACFGDTGVMAWVHQLDGSGLLERTDWIAVVGRATPSGASRGRIVLNEPGAYDVLPLWRRWAYDHGRGFPDPIRIEVVEDPSVLALAATASGIGVVTAGLVAVLLRRRRSGSRARDRANGPASGRR